MADKWDRHTYIVIGRPDESIPVYRVQRESGDSSVKTLHRNMLLPFSAIPCISDLDMPSPSVPMKSARSRQVKEPRVVSHESHSESDSSESDTSQIVYVIPQRRKHNSQFSKSDRTHVSTPNDVSSVSGRSGESSYVSQSPSRLSHNTVENFSHPNETSGPQDNQNLSNTGGNEQASDLDPPAEPPRRSGRVRQAPNRYGDWLIHQQSVDPEEIIHWV